MSAFLDNLGGVLSQQFSLGDNKNTSLNLVENGTTIKNGQLGSFATQFDQSAQRSYTEEGFNRTNYYNYTPKQLELILQEPTATILVKKRMFSSLAENFRTDLGDQHEMLFIKATKILFQNKCAQISAYEKLFKISQISTAIGQVDENLLPIIFSLTDTITQVPGQLGQDGIQSSINGALSGFKNIVDRVREIYAMSKDAETTTWITNIPDSFQSTVGQGTGVIELTTCSSFNTTTSIKFGKGSFSLNFSDPYEYMLITLLDIEKAINDTINQFYSNSFIQLGIQTLDETISLQKNLLNANRAARGAQPIIFIINPDTFLGQRVQAIVDGIGFQINFDANIIGNITNTNTIDPGALIGSEQLGNNGLSSDDVSLFNNIVSSYYTQLSTAANTRRQAIATNQDTKRNLNLLRKKLRLHYGNKLIIQPMDTVSIYISSKKKTDTKILGGLQNNFSGLGFLQGINNLTQDIKDTFGVNQNYSIEKSIFVGNDFPNWLWMAMRGQFVSEKDGSHIFAGVVKEASSEYSNGSFKVSVNGSDNSGFFGNGVVNFKPSVDVFNGSFYDPMTPFKLEFDSVTGVIKDKIELLDENKNIFDSVFVKDKSGLYAGLASTQNNYLLQDADRSKNNSVQRVFYDPEGMVYRWKEGIQSLVLYGDSYGANSNIKSTPAITNDPFAGQDIMNVLSLLISGEPYNFATFYKSAIKFDNFKRDAGSNEDPTNSYFRGLKDQLKQRNLIYGNFVPFKQLTIDDASFTKILNNQLNAIQYDSELQSLTQQRAALADKLAIFGKTSAQTLSSGTSEDKLVSQSIKTLDIQIQNKINSINDQLNQSANPPISIIGNDISFDYDSSNLNQDGSKTSLGGSRKDLQRKINFLTRRMSWKVRANEDVNFLIVDDTYDKDFDIQAFEKTFTNPELFKSEYITVGTKISTTAQILGLEVFANTQGHIEIRVPKYNRVPSSIFYKMLKLKDDLGIQLFPQFLEDLSTNQLEGAYKQIEILEDEIRLYCLALGYSTDGDCVGFINSFDKGALGNIRKISSSPGGFFFLTDESTGNVNNTIGINTLSQPDILLNYINIFKKQTSLNLFSLAARSSFVQSAVLPPNNTSNPTQFQNLQQILSSGAVKTKEEQITSRLQGKTGKIFDITQLFSNTNSATIKTSTVSSMDILQISDGIGQRLSSRQAAIKLAANSLQNIEEGITLSTGNNTGSNQTLGNNILYPNSSQNRSLPKTFEHMIEDESYDDLGPGSGSRFIIKNSNIKSYTITEDMPPFTSIEVTGRLGDLFVQNNELPSDLNVFTNGNALTTAAAIDYDLWRMYGISLPQSIDAPYLSDPDTQCAPYAVSILNKARKEILNANITIVGNEYQQPGEVVYLENRDLLFYVESVSHSFTFGQGFDTSMVLNYGHNPGEYIPTFLDVIGKVLYKNNKDTVNIINKKQGNVFNQEHIGSIVGSYDPSISSTPENDIINGGFGAANKVALQKMIDYASQSLSIESDNINPVLEVRIYYNSKSIFSSSDDYASEIQQLVYQYLIGKSDLIDNTLPTGSTTATASSPRLSAFSQQIKILNVDSGDTAEFRYPSAKAFHYAREIVDRSSQNQQGLSSDQQDIDNAIYSYIVDCWIVFNNPAITPTGT